MRNLINTDARTNPFCKAAQEYMQLKRQYSSFQVLKKEEIRPWLTSIGKIIDYEPPNFPDASLPLPVLVSSDINLYLENCLKVNEIRVSDV